MIVTLAGKPGAGKSEVAKILAKTGGFEILSSGGFLRKLAAEAGQGIAEFQAVAECDGGVIDRTVDLATRSVLADPNKHICIDGRMAFAFARHPFVSVLLTCDEEVAASRVYAARRGDECYGSAKEAAEGLRRRRCDETARYRKLYGVDYLYPGVHDLVFDSTNTAPDVIAETIMREAEELSFDTRLGEITTFRGDYFFLSNMYECPVNVFGKTFTSSEAAYQSRKVEEPLLRERFVSLDGKAAKKLAGELGVRSDWEEIRLNVMKEVLYAKFTQNPELAEKLVKTTGFCLIESNDWHDGFFGVCTCEQCLERPALNLLGKNLMKLRRDLFAQELR